MSNTNTGGPAFPFVMPSDTGHIIANGMTLRDYFAAKALPMFNGTGDFNWAAEKAYEVADAMLKARDA